MVKERNDRRRKLPMPFIAVGGAISYQLGQKSQASWESEIGAVKGATHDLPRWDDVDRVFLTVHHLL